MARKDITFGEPFHRTKQTLLLFWSAIVVSRIPGIDVTGTSGLLGVSFKGVNIDHVRWLLWAGAAYYFVGFLLELVAERHSNNGTSRFGVSDTLGDELTNVAKLMSERVGSISIHDNQLRQAGLALARSAEMFAENMNAIKSMAVPNEHGGRSFVGQEAVAGYESGAKILPERHEESSKQITESAMYMKRSADKMESVVFELRTDIRRLAADIRWWKRIQFYGWDFGGALSMFAIATFLSPRPF